jgi:anti-anti-sigma factor
MRARTDSFWVRVENGDDVTHLRLTGRLDSPALSHLDDKVDEARGRDVVLDLGGLTYMDASAWLAVMSCERRVRAWGRDLRLENAFGAIREMFELAESEHLLPGPGGR